jgi:predicted SnoaL-like aldol condensation-catalyzing enzyme
MKRIQFSVLLIVLLLTFSCVQADKTAATNREIANRFTDEVWNGGNLDVLDDLMAEEFVRHNPPSVDPAEINGREEMREYIANIHSTYPDFHVEVHNQLAEGDLTAGSWTVTGTDAESGIAIEFPGITINRFQDGKIAEIWISWDTEGQEDQLPNDVDTEDED